MALASTISSDCRLSGEMVIGFGFWVLGFDNNNGIYNIYDGGGLCMDISKLVHLDRRVGTVFGL